MAPVIMAQGNKAWQSIGKNDAVSILGLRAWLGVWDGVRFRVWGWCLRA